MQRRLESAEHRSVLRGSAIQSPLYAEDCSYATILPFAVRIRLALDSICFCLREMPRFHAYLEDTYLISDGADRRPARAQHRARRRAGPGHGDGRRPGPGVEISTFDEPFRTPSPIAHQLAIRTQQVIQLETQVAAVDDVLQVAGSPDGDLMPPIVAALDGAR